MRALANASALDLAVWKETLCHRHTSEMHALKSARFRSLAKNQFCATTANVEYEPQTFVWRQAVRNAVIDEPRFLDAGNDLDRMAKC